MKNAAAESLVCLGCACGCQDALELKSEQQQIASTVECWRCQAWIDKQQEAAPRCNTLGHNTLGCNTLGRNTLGRNTLGCNKLGKECSLESAVTDVVRKLSEAKAPLFCGFAGLVTENQRRVVRLAQKVGGYLDWTSGLHQVESILALQRAGRVSCTYGEIKNRADLIVYWDLDVAQVAPRFAERFVRTDNLVTISKSPQGNSRLDFLTATKLRMIGRPSSESNHENTASEIPQIDDLLMAVKQATYCVFVIHSGESQIDRVEHEQLTKLVVELNRETQVRLVDLAFDENAGGAENVMTWLTGFPMAVKFGRDKQVEFEPGRFTVERVLEAGATDLIVVFGELQRTKLSKSAQKALAEVHVIEVGRWQCQAGFSVTQIPTTADVFGRGTVFRGDGVPLFTNADNTRENSDLSSIARILDKITGRLGVVASSLGE